MASAGQIRITVEDRATDVLIDALIRITGLDCTKEASCETGDHTLSWPCVLAPVDD